MCIPQGAAAMQKELGPLGTGARRILRDKFDALGGLWPFFACNASSL